MTVSLFTQGEKSRHFLNLDHLQCPDVCIATAIAVCVFCSMYISSKSALLLVGLAKMCFKVLGDPYGIHQWDVPASKVFNERWLKVGASLLYDLIRALLTFMYQINIAAGIALYGASAMLVKTSILLLYFAHFTTPKLHQIHDLGRDSDYSFVLHNHLSCVCGLLRS